MIRTQPFGNTGHMSTVTLFGAAALSRVTQKEADQTLEVLLEYGVNHIDTAASYGESELRIGPWMKEHRKDFFLATKTGYRKYEPARTQIRQSLERLQVEQVDLIQLHGLFHPDEWDTAMGKVAGEKGALQAAIEAREEGLVRFIGVTGHGMTVAAMHKRSLAEFAFDSVLLPYNYVMHKNNRYIKDFDDVVKLCEERNVAVQTIKSVSRGPWATTAKNAATWYQPLEDQDALDTAVHWAMGRTGVFLNTLGDIHVLPRMLDAASRYESRPRDEAMEDLLDKYRMTSIFGI
ncbi:MAG: aldo/keto reductase [Chloroflexota bacterium]